MPESHFVRRRLAPVVGKRGYQSFREHVRKDFRRTCAYCLMEEIWAAGVENFELDHFRPMSLFPELALDYYNLYWSCHVCNQAKRSLWPSPEMMKEGHGFVDFCASTFDDHFIALENGEWQAKTLAAQFTIEMLRLNRDHLIGLRLRLAAMATI